MIWYTAHHTKSPHILASSWCRTNCWRKVSSMRSCCTRGAAAPVPSRSPNPTSSQTVLRFMRRLCGSFLTRWRNSPSLWISRQVFCVFFTVQHAVKCAAVYFVYLLLLLLLIHYCFILFIQLFFFKSSDLKMFKVCCIKISPPYE